MDFKTIANRLKAILKVRIYKALYDTPYLESKTTIGYDTRRN